MNSARYRTFAAALLCTVCPVSISAQSSAPVQATAEVDDAALATTGRATLRLRFTSEAPLRTPYAVRVELHAQGRMILRRDHAPPTPTTAWQPDETIAYDLPLYFPLTPKADGEVRVLVGFLDPDADEPIPPLTRRRSSGGRAIAMCTSYRTSNHATDFALLCVTAD